MTNSPGAEPVDAFTGQFDLREWKPVVLVGTSNDTLAWEVAGGLVSCQTAVLTLAIGKPERVLLVGGARPLWTPVNGDLRVDGKSFAFSGHLVPENPNRARGSLRIPGQSRTLAVNLELRRNRLTATLHGRTSKNLPDHIQTFLFYRVGAKGPPRRPPEKAPAPVVDGAARSGGFWNVPKVAAEAPTTAAPTPKTDPAKQLAAEWTLKLSNTQLSHVENDRQSDYGSSTYIERRVVLRLYENLFVLDRSTLTRVSIRGMTSSAPSQSRLSGTWTIVVANPPRVRLQLKSTEGEQLTYFLAAGGSDSIVVDGTPWRWSK